MDVAIAGTAGCDGIRVRTLNENLRADRLVLSHLPIAAGLYKMEAK